MCIETRHSAADRSSSPLNLDDGEVIGHLLEGVLGLEINVQCEEQNAVIEGTWSCRSSARASLR